MPTRHIYDKIKCPSSIRRCLSVKAQALQIDVRVESSAIVGALGKSVTASGRNYLQRPLAFTVLSLLIG